jgi:hypothetical protein
VGCKTGAVVIPCWYYFSLLPDWCTGNTFMGCYTGAVVTVLPAEWIVGLLCGNSKFCYMKSHFRLELVTPMPVTGFSLSGWCSGNTADG